MGSLVDTYEGCKGGEQMALFQEPASVEHCGAERRDRKRNSTHISQKHLLIRVLYQFVNEQSSQGLSALSQAKLGARGKVNKPGQVRGEKGSGSAGPIKLGVRGKVNPPQQTL